jgi:hypothetical protein
LFHAANLAIALCCMLIAPLSFTSRCVADPSWFLEGSEGLVFSPLVLNSIDRVDANVEIVESELPFRKICKVCCAGIAV